MTYKFHHVGVYSSDYTALRFTFCELMHHREANSEELFGVHALFLTQERCDLRLALYEEKPSHSWFGDAFGIKYVAFEVEDLQRAVAQLQDNQVELLEPPAASASYRYAVVRSIEGLPIVLLEVVDDAVESRQLAFADNPFGLILTHTAVLTDDLSASETFWRENFGLHRFAGNYCGDSGFIALADTHWQPERHPVFMELLCPPNVLNVDQYGYELAGVSYFHLSYYSNDVGASWQYLVDGGMHPALPAYIEAGTAAEDSFVIGVDQMAFELFGGDGAREILDLSDIREVDETFCVSAREMTESSGEMNQVPEDYVFRPMSRG